MKNNTFIQWFIAWKGQKSTHFTISKQLSLISVCDLTTYKIKDLGCICVRL